MTDETVLIAADFDPDENSLMHEGVLRKSGRYPWGSGENPHQRNKQFLDHVDELKRKGMSEAQIAEGLGLKSTTELRAIKSNVKNQVRAANVARAEKLKEDGHSTVAIGEKMGLNESSVRNLLDKSVQERQGIANATADFFKSQIKPGEYLDIGKGVENHRGISPEKKNRAIKMLEAEGYKVFYVPVQQLGTGKTTNVKILADKDATFGEVMKNQDKIKSVVGYTEDGARSFRKIEPPKAIDPKRVAVRYGDEGGAQKDGVIELRRGVDDISLGASNYAQVRIQVGKDKYLKGMAMYSDKMPDGVDMVFNTNKKSTGNKLDAMKSLSDDADLPFGSIVRQKFYIDKNGKPQQSVLNIVGTSKKDENGREVSISGEEGGWYGWGRTLSSQMLSKQSPALAKQQLELSYQVKKSEFDDIMSLTNPTVRKKLLEEYADGADSASTHLKAAGLPRTRSHVILPINSLKDNEVYAPNYRDGEKVVLIRHPHGGTFEIPELTVNNRNREAKGVMKNAKDAVGINSKVAERLSGADFDGDTVLVIPNNSKAVKSTAPLKQLENFDPKTSYKPYDGMRTIDGGTYNAATNKVDYGNGKPKGANKQKQMGDVSNLITDMTIKGANLNEIARAVKHSMVVIDAEKHMLNYKQSAADNNIAELKTKYQGAPRAGASTLVSLSKSDVRVGDRKARPSAEGGAIDPLTGKKMYKYSGEEYPVRKVNKRTGEVIETMVPKTIKSKRMLETDDANTLSSGTPMESVYANHANRLKALANGARKEALSQKAIPTDKSAKDVYKNEVATLNAKLNIALKNAPRERQAQLVANTIVKTKRDANPDLEPSELKKVKAMALVDARARVGAAKQAIQFTDSEWAAIQAGAVSGSKLKAMLDNADMDQVKQLAMPRTATVMVPAKVRQAQAMLDRGYTQAEVADALGVPVSTMVSAVGAGS